MWIVWQQIIHVKCQLIFSERRKKKYLRILSQSFLIPFYYLLMYLNNCWMSDKQCRSWSDYTFNSVWSLSTLFTQTCLFDSEFEFYSPVNTVKVTSSQWLKLLTFPGQTSG